MNVMTARWAAPFARLLRFAVLAVVVAVPLGGCTSFSSLFGGAEEVAPDEPPEKLYNEGIFLLDKRRDFKAASKKLGAQGPHHGCLRAV